jgi:hypothetical protein
MDLENIERAMGEHSKLQLGQRDPCMDLSSALRCLLSHYRDRQPRWLLAPTTGLLLGAMASWEARQRRFAYKYIIYLITSNLKHQLSLHLRVHCRIGIGRTLDRVLCMSGNTLRL